MKTGPEKTRIMKFTHRFQFSNSNNALMKQKENALTINKKSKSQQRK